MSELFCSTERIALWKAQRALHISRQNSWLGGHSHLAGYRFACHENIETFLSVEIVFFN